MPEFKKECKKRGYDLVKLDLTRSLEEQGPFCVIFHKCTDVIIKANGGDPKVRIRLTKIVRRRCVSYFALENSVFDPVVVPIIMVFL